MPLALDLLERRQFGFEFPQYLLAMRSLPCCFLGVMTHDIAAPTFPLAPHHFLDA
jgi:hypothetical protein